MKLLFFLGALSSLTGFAQDLVYKPKNPASEDTFNYQWMMVLQSLKTSLKTNRLKK
jgi:hypothetical protein